MTDKIPLFDDPEPGPLDEVEALPTDHSCQRCALHERANNVCINPEGQPGGILIVGMYPGQVEDKLGRPNVGPAGAELREILTRVYDGPVAMDNAVRCWPAGREVGVKPIQACRSYLTRTVDLVEPTRIIALGGKAFQSVLGRAPPPRTVAGGFGWIRRRGRWIPVAMLPHIASAMGNSFRMRQFERMLHSAIHDEPPQFPDKIATEVASCDQDEASAAKESAHLADPKFVAFDVETRGLLYEDDFRIISAAITTPDERSWVWTEAALANPETFEPLRDILTDSNINKVAHNWKYEWAACMWAWDLEPGPVHCDTMVWRRLLNTESDGGLDKLAELVGCGAHKVEADRYLNKIQRRMRKHERDLGIKSESNPKAYIYEGLPRKVLSRYNARDTVVTARLAKRFRREMRSEGDIYRVWKDLVRPGMWALSHVERWGIRVSESALDSISQQFKRREDEATRKLESYVPGLNPNANGQIQEALFGSKGFGLKPPKKTKTGQSAVDRDVLERIAAEREGEAVGEFVSALMEHRRLSKLRGTYADGIRPHILSDGRVHCTYNITGAETGRLSSDSPNLQNIPQRTEEGRLIRTAFVPPPGRTFLQLDYSRLEVHVAAMLSGDQKMIEILKSGEDIHTNTAASIWSTEPSQVSKSQRTAAKTVVFGTIYGQDAKSLSEDLGIQESEAQGIIDGLLSRFPRLGEWIEECKREAMKTGCAWTWWNGRRARRRLLYDISNQGEDYDPKRATATRSSWNMPVQGTASDFCLASLVEIVKWVLNDDAPALVVGTVHDSIMLEVDDDHLYEIARICKRIMESWDTPHGVPLFVDAEIGPSWGSLGEVEVEKTEKADVQ